MSIVVGRLDPQARRPAAIDARLGHLEPRGVARQRPRVERAAEDLVDGPLDATLRVDTLGEVLEHLLQETLFGLLPKRQALFARREDRAAPLRAIEVDAEVTDSGARHRHILAPYQRLRSHSATIATVRVRKGVALGLVVGAIGMIVRPTAIGLRMEEDVGIPWLFALRGPVTPPPRVAVVSIDKTSAQQLGLDASEWPPTRRAHASVDSQSHASQSLGHRHGRVVRGACDAGGGRRTGKGNDRERRGRAGPAAAIALACPEPPCPPTCFRAQSPSSRRAPSAWRRFRCPGARGRRCSGRSSRPRSASCRRCRPPRCRCTRLPVLDRFVALLEEAGVGHLDAVPRQVRSAADSQQLMRSLRRAIAGDRAAASRAMARLGHDAVGAAQAVDERHAALLGLYAGGDTYYLNFYGPPGTIETIPFHELLQERQSRRNLAGKVVFVGESTSSFVTSAEQGDTFVTVYSTADGIDLSGAEIGATAFANLLSGRMLRPVGAWTWLAVLLLFGTLVGVLARLLPGAYATALAFALGAFGAALAQYLFTAHSLLVPLAVPLLVQLPLGLFIGVLSRYLDIRKQVPIEVDPYARQQLFLGVCLATDVAGYTSLAEHLNRDELHDLLNDYHEMLRRLVTARRGLVWGRGGDSALSVWKVSATEPRRKARLPKWLDRQRRAEQAGRLNACMAAIEIRDAIDAFNRRHPAAQQLPTRIGLDVGEVGLGPVGGELQAVGSPANIASRIESLNKTLSTRLLASARVVSGPGGDWDTPPRIIRVGREGPGSRRRRDSRAQRGRLRERPRAPGQVRGGPRSRQSEELARGRQALHRASSGVSQRTARPCTTGISPPERRLRSAIGTPGAFLFRGPHQM